jgi:dTDP-4-amino-4,6-dideoxygalactose transaminase
MIQWVPKKSIHTPRVQELLQESLDTNHFTNGGPVVAKLESAIRSYLQIDSSKSVVAVSNGTVALWAAVAAFELFHSTPMTFATQSFTFPASAQGYLQSATICDIDSNGGLDLSTLHPDSVQGIIVTNVFGHVVPIDSYISWAKQHNKFLVFDNAATSFTSYNSKNSCNFGHAATISFHHTKPIGFGEGGAIIIDSQYEKSLRNCINFGIDNTSTSPCWNSKCGNYKMSDIQAAYILQYFEKIHSIKSHHESLYSYFCNSLAPLTLPSIRLFPNFSSSTPFVSCLCVFSNHSDAIIKDLLENNIYCRKYYKPLINTPVATMFYSTIVCISLTVDMSFSDINRIISILQKYGESK